jgi:hypothetical protein
MKMKKAARAGKGSKGAATTTRQSQVNRAVAFLSSPYTRKSYPGRRDRAVPQPPAENPAKASSLSVSLGLLVLLLTSRANELPARLSRRGWALAERWLSDLVGTKRMQEAV